MAILRKLLTTQNQIFLALVKLHAVFEKLAKNYGNDYFIRSGKASGVCQPLLTLAYQPIGLKFKKTDTIDFVE